MRQEALRRKPVEWVLDIMAKLRRYGQCIGRNRKRHGSVRKRREWVEIGNIMKVSSLQMVFIILLIL